MKVYAGRRTGDGTCKVVVDDHAEDHHGGAADAVRWSSLNPRLDLWNHSPTGFDWGYGGSGPAQLALAVLADCLGDDRAAVRLHQAFKARVIAGLPRGDENRWRLTEDEVRAAVAEILSDCPHLRAPEPDA